MTTKPADEVKVPSRIWVQMIDGSTMGSGVAFTNRVEEGDVEFVPASDLARVEAERDRAVTGLVNLHHVLTGYDCPRHLALGLATSAVSATITRLAEVERERDRLLDEIQQPRCNDCDAVLGDNWCADCASKIFRQRAVAAVRAWAVKGRRDAAEQYSLMAVAKAEAFEYAVELIQQLPATEQPEASEEGK